MILRLLIAFSISTQIFADANITVLDVKEGQSILISSGSKGVLIDTGHAGQSQNLIQKLHNNDVENIKTIILTHLHPDHASGYFRLKESFPDAIIYSNCHPLPSNIKPDMTRWVYESLNKDKMHRCLKATDQLNVFDIEIDVLWPFEFIDNNLNHHSLILSLKQKEKTILVMGDAGIIAEKTLLKNNRLPENINALVVGHHGAIDATSEAFILKAKPDTAIISVNKNNIRGYPSEEVIQRLIKYNIKTYRTDKHGDIRL